MMRMSSSAKVNFCDKKPVHFVASKKSWLVNHEGKLQGSFYLSCWINRNRCKLAVGKIRLKTRRVFRISVLTTV